MLSMTYDWFKSEIRYELDLHKMASAALKAIYRLKQATYQTIS